MAAADPAGGPLGADSSGVETTRYETAARPDRKKGDFVETRQKAYLKYHVTAVLGLQVILEAVITPGNANDGKVLRVMLDGMRRHGPEPAPSLFNADRGYDSDENFRMLFGMSMIPNIKQRRHPAHGGRSNRGKPSRSRAAGIFNSDEYGQRGMIEGIFGGEESKRHQLHCRLIREDNRLRFGKIRAIAWNIKVLNRFRCARRLRIHIPAYGVAACA